MADFTKPLSTLGNVTANTRAKAIDVLEYCESELGRWPGVLCGMGSSSEHATGRAVDFMISQNGRGLDSELGNVIAGYLLANADRFGVAWFIWRQRIYPAYGSFVTYGNFIANPNGGSRLMEDRGSVTQNHYDHIHVLFGIDKAIEGGKVTKEQADRIIELLEKIAERSLIVSDSVTPGADGVKFDGHTYAQLKHIHRQLDALNNAVGN